MNIMSAPITYTWGLLCMSIMCKWVHPITYTWRLLCMSIMSAPHHLHMKAAMYEHHECIPSLTHEGCYVWASWVHPITYTWRLLCMSIMSAPITYTWGLLCMSIMSAPITYTWGLHSMYEHHECTPSLTHEGCYVWASWVHPSLTHEGCYVWASWVHPSLTHEGCYVWASWVHPITYTWRLLCRSIMSAPHHLHMKAAM